MPKRNIKAVDFFCSGGGMTKGMTQAGIQVIAGIDFDPDCKSTYEFNNKGSKFILEDVFQLTAKELQLKLSLKKNDDDLLLIGCSPCQFWSVIRTDKSKSAQSKNLLSEFYRFVDFFNPGFVVVENVPGIVSKSDESGLTSFIENLELKGYIVHFNVVNLSEYGVPQTRRRFTLIANRVTNKKLFPKKPKSIRNTVKDYIGIDKGFPKVNAGHQDNSKFQHSVSNISDKNLLRIKGTPHNGGNSSWWRNKKNIGREKYKGDGFPDSYSRMHWNKPAPTITTKFTSISNGRFVHPVENRGLSLREGATLQTFPKYYFFHSTSIAAAARMIGNAVPPAYAKKIGLAIVNSH